MLQYQMWYCLWCSIAFTGIMVSLAHARHTVAFHRMHQGFVRPCRCPACVSSMCVVQRRSTTTSKFPKQLFFRNDSESGRLTDSEKA